SDLTLQQSYCGVDYARVHESDVHSASLLHGGQTIRKYFQDQLSNLLRVKVEPEGEVRSGIAGLRDKGSDGQSHREHDHARCVVLVLLLADNDSLRSLGCDAQGRHPEVVKALPVGSRKATSVHTRDAQLEAAVVRGAGGNQATQPGDIGFTSALDVVD